MLPTILSESLDRGAIFLRESNGGEGDTSDLSRFLVQMDGQSVISATTPFVALDTPSELRGPDAKLNIVAMTPREIQTYMTRDVLQNPLLISFRESVSGDHTQSAIIRNIEEHLASVRGTMRDIPSTWTIFQHDVPDATEGSLTDALLQTAVAGMLRSAGFVGVVNVVQNSHAEPRSVVAFAAKVPPRDAEKPFRVLAILMGFNEADIVQASLQALLDQGCSVHFIDNWSTDDTLSVVRRVAARLKKENSPLSVTWEQFPREGPVASGAFQLFEFLRRKEEVTREVEADWYIHADVDELLLSAWPGVTLQEGFRIAASLGYSGVRFEVANFPPTSNTFVQGDPSLTFNHFEWEAPKAGERLQVRAWARQPGMADLKPSGGREAVFAGRKVFPVPFVIRHYSIRSQSHGERKVSVSVLACAHACALLLNRPLTEPMWSFSLLHAFRFSFTASCASQRRRWRCAVGTSSMTTFSLSRASTLCAPQTHSHPRTSSSPRSGGASGPPRAPYPPSPSWRASSCTSVEVRFWARKCVCLSASRPF